jgi:hypothetical protein
MVPGIGALPARNDGQMVRPALLGTSGGGEERFQAGERRISWLIGETKMNVRKAFLTFVAATGLAALAPAAQGIIYPIRFDPEFNGTIKVDIAPVCLTGSGVFDVSTIVGCQVDLVAGVNLFPFPAGTPNFMDQVGYTDYIDIASDIEVIGGVFTQLRTRPGHILLMEGGNCIDTPCDAAMVEFDIGGGIPGFPGEASMTIGTYDCPDGCDFIPGDEEPLSSLYRVPEPGTLGLLLAALGAGVFARRRNAAA